MKEYITGNHVANAIRMMRTVHVGAFLIVEGENDARVFNVFVDHEGCKIEIGFGKHNVIAAIKSLNAARVRGVLAIVDADFRNIGENDVNEPNLVYTDDHDLECMMLRSAAFDRLLAEFGIAARVEAFARDHGPLVGYALAHSASTLGHLLLTSLKNDHGLIFDGLTFSRFVNPQSLRIDISGMLTEVKNKSQKHGLNWTVIEQDVLALQRMGHDSWQVCCGHHVLEILSIALRHTFASHSSGEVAPNVLKKCLRLTYGKPEFFGTRLYVEIRTWETHNAPFRILQAAG